MRRSTKVSLLQMVWMLIICVPMAVVYIVKGIVLLVAVIKAKRNHTAVPTPCYSSRAKNWIPR